MERSWLDRLNNGSYISAARSFVCWSFSIYICFFFVFFSFLLFSAVTFCEIIVGQDMRCDMHYRLLIDDDDDDEHTNILPYHWFTTFEESNKYSIWIRVTRARCSASFFFCRQGIRSLYVKSNVYSSVRSIFALAMQLCFLFCSGRN